MNHVDRIVASGGRSSASPPVQRVTGGSRLPLAGLLLLLGLSFLATGCRKPPTGPKDDPKATSGPKADPWEAAVKRVRKDPDAVGVRAALNALNTELADRPGLPKPPALVPDAEAKLAALVPLSDADKTEIRGGTFTPFDAAYLAECLYLRDAARALELPGVPPDQVADVAFAWVCRQVALNPWVIPIQLLDPKAAGGHHVGTALPPAYVLRRGHGSGLERGYVFLALLQQMGLDGCLVGPPEAGTVPATYVAYGPDGQTVLTGSPRGPFWAVGVRAGNDVRLYDPWRGTPFPATLGQLKANPDAHKAWIEDKASVSGLTAEGLKAAAVFLAVPVNALAPRLAPLEAKLRDELGVRLTADPAKLRDAFPDPKPKFWNPPADRFAYGRAARTFLPVEQGGADPTDQFFNANLATQIPAAGQIIPQALLKYPDILQDVGQRVLVLARASYGTAFVTPPPTPREQLQRGRFQDAAVSLVDKQDRFARGLERLRQNRDLDNQIQKWAEVAAQRYDDLGRTRGDPTAVAAAQAAIENHLREPTVQLMVDRAVSELGQAEATFLLALAKHEQAEHAQARLDRAAPGPDADRLRKDAANAWKAADGEWKTYLAGPARAQAGMPGRADHAKALAARADHLAAAKK